MKLKIKKLHKDAIVPRFATDGAACFDLHALNDEYWPVIHGSPMTVDTGLAVEIPPGSVMLIFSRSGHGFNHDTRLSNAVGVIDVDYRGPIKVRLTRDMSTTASMTISKGDRIAQALILELPYVHIEEVEELSETARGAGGFGSTGS